MTEVVQPKRFSFLGGALCLDFANTVDWHAGPAPIDRLHGYGDLIAWALQADVLTEEEAQGLLNRARHRPAEAQSVLDRSMDLREAFFRLFRAHFEGESPAPSDLAVLNAHLAAVMNRLRVVPDNDRYAWEWENDGTALEMPLWPVVRSAADLLTSDQLPYVRMCGGPGCGWLFLDTTKNKRRRWCSMDDCGNRAKARRFYERRRKQN